MLIWIDNVAENVEDIVFDCPRFTTHQTRLQAVTDRRLAPENIVKLMLEPKEGWNQAINELKIIYQK